MHWRSRNPSETRILDRKIIKSRKIPQKVDFRLTLSNRFSELENDCQTEARSRDWDFPIEIESETTPQPTNPTRRDLNTPSHSKTYFPNQKPENEKVLQRQKAPAPPPLPNAERPLVAIIGDSTIKNVTSFQIRGILRNSITNS